MAKFNPDNHMKSIKGKPYLPVQWRLVWFREDHPDWSIITEVTDHREDKQATAKAYIKDNEGRVISTAHKTARPRKIIPDYVELAETGAIGRALAYTGYGTQFSPDILEDENGVVDSPVTKKATQGSTDAPVGKKYSTTASGKAKVSQYFAPKSSKKLSMPYTRIATMRCSTFCIASTSLGVIVLVVIFLNNSSSKDTPCK